MFKSDFNFKQYQQYKRSWKMPVRFIIYSIVMAVLIYLIYNLESEKESASNQKIKDSIDIEIDAVQVK